jgi:hypothetical protein
MSFSNLTRNFSKNKCCGLGQNYNIPAHIGNLIIFELTGYKYRTLPIWFDKKGIQMDSLQFSSNIEHNKLKYTWNFYKKEGELCSEFFHLLTSDDIFPVIYEKITGTYMKVERIAQNNGYTSWKVSCLNKKLT